MDGETFKSLAVVIVSISIPASSGSLPISSTPARGHRFRRVDLSLSLPSGRHSTFHDGRQILFQDLPRSICIGQALRQHLRG